MSRKMANQRERRLEKDKTNKRRDGQEKPERYKATRQIEIYCNACDCYIRKYQLWKHRKTAHIRNGGPQKEEERNMKEEEDERKRKEEDEKKKLEEAEENI